MYFKSKLILITDLELANTGGTSGEEERLRPRANARGEGRKEGGKEEGGRIKRDGERCRCTYTCNVTLEYSVMHAQYSTKDW